MKLIVFRGDLSNISAEKEALVMVCDCVQVEGDGEQVTCLASVPGTNEVFYGSTTGVLKRVSISKGALPTQQLHGHGSVVLCCCVFVIDAGVYVASGSADGSCRIWDTQSGTCTAVLKASSLLSGAYITSSAPVFKTY